MSIETSQVIVATAGVDGSAAGSGTIPAKFQGKLLAVRIDYSAGQPNTTDVTLTNNGYTIMSKASSLTDSQHFPRVNIAGDDGAVVAGLYDYFYVSGQIGVTIAQADDAETVTVTVTVLNEV